jgi:hypothetical protein
MISSARAYTIASSWGSLVRSGDPGAVFYSFPYDDATPQSEDHRERLIAYTKHCQKTASQSENFNLKEQRANSRELKALLSFFQTVKSKTHTYPVDK